jgi:hypothetical protein
MLSLTEILWATGMGPQVKAKGPKDSPIRLTTDPQGIWAETTSWLIFATVPIKVAAASI